MKKYLFATIGIFVSLLILIYLGGSWFFQEHYFYGTVIDGVNYALKTPKTVEKEIKDKLKNYKLVIHGRNDVSDEIYAEDIEIRPVFDGSLQRIAKEQKGFLWLSAFWKKPIYDVEKFAEYDEDLFIEKLKTLKVFQPNNNRKPEDAYIGEYQSNTKTYEIIAENPGSKLNEKVAKEEISDALLILEEELDLSKEGCFEKPKVTVRNPGINKLVKKMNQYVGAQITYQYNGSEVLIDGDLIHEWLYVEDEKVFLNEVAVREYVNGLARVHDTFGKKREFQKSNGEMLTITSGAYGFWTNRQEETKQLIASIKAGERTTREPVYHSRGYVEGPNDIGDSYVEIDLGNQHLYMYVDGEVVVESDFVSGSMVKGYQTPPGVYGLTYKERNATLRGQGYTSPVSYWMPFNGNVGMHDASWRKEFGGDIYLRNGSHGCINLPSKEAEEIYTRIEQGFPVVCYY